MKDREIQDQKKAEIAALKENRPDRFSCRMASAPSRSAIARVDAALGIVAAASWTRGKAWDDPPTKPPPPLPR